MNEGTLNQNIDITFGNFSNLDNKYLENIVYELQLEDEYNNYNTIIKSNLSDLKELKTTYNIQSKKNLNFKSKIHISQDIDIYDQSIEFDMRVKAYQTNDYNQNYFVKNTHQTNSITIQQPEIEEPQINNFITTAKIKDGSSVSLLINLKDYYDVNDDFTFNVKKVEGSFTSKYQTVVKNKQRDEIQITFAGEYIDIDTIDTHIPSKDKMNVDITYKKDNQTYTKYYTIEFIRQTIKIVDEVPIYDNEIIEAYFYERN